MLPFFYRYDHTNYARRGTVYLAQMNQLPNAVKEEFVKVVKVSNSRFNQVDSDRSEERLKSIGGKGDGIVK